MTVDIQMDPRLECRIVEKKAALDLQRPLPAPIVAKLYGDLPVHLTYHSNAGSLSRSQMLNRCRVHGGDDPIKAFNCAGQKAGHSI